MNYIVVRYQVDLPLSPTLPPSRAPNLSASLHRTFVSTQTHTLGHRYVFHPLTWHTQLPIAIDYKIYYIIIEGGLIKSCLHLHYSIPFVPFHFMIWWFRLANSLRERTARTAAVGGNAHLLNCSMLDARNGIPKLPIKRRQIAIGNGHRERHRRVKNGGGGGAFTAPCHVTDANDNEKRVDILFKFILWHVYFVLCVVCKSACVRVCAVIHWLCIFHECFRIYTTNGSSRSTASDLGSHLNSMNVSWNGNDSNRNSVNIGLFQFSRAYRNPCENRSISE